MPDTDSGSGFDPTKFHPMYWLRWVITFDWIKKQWDKYIRKGVKHEKT